jgi:hypothetical protein
MKSIVFINALLLGALWVAPTVQADSTNAEQRFEAIKALAGKWQGYKDDDKKDVINVEFKLLSGGSAVAEFLMTGTTMEMLRVFNRDGDHVMLTHYCMVGNQSRMRAAESTDKKHFNFSFTDGTNLKSKDDMHVHNISMTIKNDKELIESFEMFDTGMKSMGAKFTLTRVK